MARLQAALRCFATLVVLALIAAPVVFAPGTGYAAAPSPAQSADTHTRAVTPDTTYGPGGNITTHAENGRLWRRVIRDEDGNQREQYTISANGDETWDFVRGAALSQRVGAIFATPIGGDLWNLLVLGPDGMTIGGESNLTRNDLDVSLSYWHSTMRQDAGGSARGAPLRFTNGPVPGVGQAGGPRSFQPQPGGLTINCFGDAACERAAAASRGQFDYRIRTFDREKAKGDDGKDPPFYKRPDLPPNGLRYDPPPPPPP